LSDPDTERLLRFFSASRDVLLSEIEAMKASADNGRKKGMGSEQADEPSQDAER
jgi:hypothetical protein